ncbi:MAG TPA: hypothetical protein VF550_21520, partial [Polyangia bacterium]
TRHSLRGSPPWIALTLATISFASCAGSGGGKSSGDTGIPGPTKADTGLPGSGGNSTSGGTATDSATEQGGAGGGSVDVTGSAGGTAGTVVDGTATGGAGGRSFDGGVSQAGAGGPPIDAPPKQGGVDSSPIDSSGNPACGDPGTTCLPATPATAAAAACLESACNPVSPALGSVVAFATQGPAGFVAGLECLVARRALALARARPPARNAVAPRAPSVANWAVLVAPAQAEALAYATAPTPPAMAVCALPVERQEVLVAKAINAPALAAAPTTSVLPKIPAAAPT